MSESKQMIKLLIIYYLNVGGSAETGCMATEMHKGLSVNCLIEMTQPLIILTSGFALVLQRNEEPNLLHHLNGDNIFTCPFCHHSWETILFINY